MLALNLKNPIILTIITSACIILFFLFLGFIARLICIKRLQTLTKSTASKTDDILVKIISKPIIIWFLMLGIYISLQVSTFPQHIVQLLTKAIVALAIFSVTIVIATLISHVIKIYATDPAVVSTSLAQSITKIIIFCIGILVILQYFGVSILPILATFGIGGLAVALALQESLANLFAGFYITISRQVRVGDYIKLSTGEAGYVIDINWRTTKIKVLPNNIILVPNAKLTQSLITNYYLPDKEMAVLVQVAVHYNSNLEFVEKITCDIGEQVMKQVTGGVTSFKPFIRFHTFSSSSINFTVILRTTEFVDQYIIKHEFIKRLHKKYTEEGIVIPYPIRALNYSQEKSEILKEQAGR